MENDASELSAIIDVLYVERPTITFHKIDDILEVGTEITAYCDSERGTPATQITWILDDEILKNETEKPYKDYFQESEVTFKLKQEHFNKSLTCRAKHPAFEQGYEDKKQPLNFHFKPVEQPIIKIKNGRVDSENKPIGHFVIRADPRPRLIWKNAGNSQKLKFNYEGESPAGSHHYSLTGSGDMEEVWNKEYTFIASNDESTNYGIYLDGTIDPATQIAAGKFLITT